MTQYHVVETPCYPAKWKVEPIDRPGDNATSNYFRTWQNAWREAERRNAKERMNTADASTNFQEVADYYRREYERAKHLAEVLQEHNAELKLAKTELQERIKQLEAAIVANRLESI